MRGGKPDPVILCRCYLAGHDAMVMTVDKMLRAALELVPRDVLAFRVVTREGKKLAIVEKLPIRELSRLSTALTNPPAPKGT